MFIDTDTFLWDIFLHIYLFIYIFHICYFFFTQAFFFFIFFFVSKIHYTSYFTFNIYYDIFSSFVSFIYIVFSICQSFIYIVYRVWDTDHFPRLSSAHERRRVSIPATPPLPRRLPAFRSSFRSPALSSMSVIRQPFSRRLPAARCWRASFQLARQAFASSTAMFYFFWSEQR